LSNQQQKPEEFRTEIRHLFLTATLISCWNTFC